MTASTRIGVPAALVLALACLAGCGSGESPPGPGAPSIATITPATGPDVGGTLVTIVGDDFDGGVLAVTFGGTTATNVTVLSRTTITCVAPAGTGSVAVAVDGALGDAAATTPFVYYDADAPTVTSVSPAFARPAGGVQALIYGAGFEAGNTQVTFGGVASPAVSVQTPTALFCTVPPGALGPVDLVVTTSMGSAILAGGFTYANLPLLDVIAGSLAGDEGALVFRDVLGGGSVLSADVGLEESGSTVRGPKAFAVENDRLIVGSQFNNTITIFNGYSTLVDGQAPDVTLSVPSSVYDLAVAGGDLYAVVGNEVHIFRDVSTLLTGDVADAILAPGFCFSADMDLVSDTLYVANFCGGGGVSVWHNASTLVGGEAPDALLGGSEVRRVRVAGNAVWAATGYGTQVQGFGPLGSLVTGMAPTYALPTGVVQAPCILAEAGGRLVLGNSDYADGPYRLVVLDLVGGSVQAAVKESDGIGFVYDLAGVGSTLVGTDLQNGFVFCYLDVTTMVNGQPPDVFLFDPRLSRPRPIHVVAGP